MAFSRQRELIRTQELVLKQQRSKLKKQSHRHLATKEEDDDDNAVVIEEKEEEGPLESDLKHGTIFVSIPSYRDPECPKTVADGLEKSHLSRPNHDWCMSTE